MDKIRSGKDINGTQYTIQRFVNPQCGVQTLNFVDFRKLVGEGA